MMDRREEQARSFLESVLAGQSRSSGGLEGLAHPADRAEAMLPAMPVPAGLEASVESAAEKVAQHEPLDGHEQFALEAIIIPDKRPAIDIVNGDYNVVHRDWLHFNEERQKKTIKRALPAAGRVDLPGHPSLPFGGTAFVVGPGLLMTNRHVAEIFCGGLGLRDLLFRPGHRAAIDFKRERSGGSYPLEVTGIAMIHPYWDMALVRVEGVPSSVHPLSLSLRDPDELVARDVAVIGYPAFDPRNDTAVQNLVFGGVYDVKRLMPGKLNGRASIRSFEKDVPSAKHDSSTLGGASGSLVLDVENGEVVALHFAGIYLSSNYGVPAADLARDPRVVDAGVSFAGTPRPGPGPWDAWWQTAEAPPASGGSSGGGGPAASLQRAPRTGGGARWTIPIEISVDIGGAVSAGDMPAGATPPPAAAARPAAAEVIERFLEPIHEEDYGNRSGYREDFLGSGLKVPLPEPADLSVAATLEDGDHVIRYHHFSVVMHRKRRLALFTACNIDASPARKKPEPGRDYTRDGLGGLGRNDRERWFTDPRLRGSDQLPDRFFDKDNGAFDKGHLVRREDVAWGDSYAEVQAANGDTYHTTNCSPQVAGFNRSNHKDNWGALEDLVLKQARNEKLCVFAGPVLSESDRRFVGVDERSQIRVQIPEEYWKVVVAEEDGALRSFAFILKQELSSTPLEFLVPPAWQQHMISLAELEARLGTLRFPSEVHAADQISAALGEAVRQSLRFG